MREREREIALFIPPISFQMYWSEGEKIKVHWIKYLQQWQKYYTNSRNEIAKTLSR